MKVVPGPFSIVIQLTNLKRISLPSTYVRYLLCYQQLFLLGNSGTTNLKISLKFKNIQKCIQFQIRFRNKPTVIMYYRHIYIYLIKYIHIKRMTFTYLYLIDIFSMKFSLEKIILKFCLFSLKTTRIFLQFNQPQALISKHSQNLFVKSIFN